MQADDQKFEWVLLAAWGRLKEWFIALLYILFLENKKTHPVAYFDFLGKVQHDRRFILNKEIGFKWILVYETYLFLP